MSKKEAEKNVCVTHRKNMGGTCVSRRMHFVSIFWIAFMSGFIALTVIKIIEWFQKKNLREKMTNLSKQIKITIDMNVVNKNDNSQTTSSSASNWTRIKKKCQIRQ